MHNKSDFHIKKLSLADWKLYKKLRLEAVKLYERYYGDSYEESLKFSDERWQKAFTNPESAAFVLLCQDKPIGLTGVFRDQGKGEPKTGLMVSSYIKPEYQGQGLSQLFYEARINWALENTDWRWLKISHRDGNTSSKKAMITHGFKPIGSKTTLFGDDTKDKDYQYVLDLDTLRPKS